jgi:hypothetical protein
MILNKCNKLMSSLLKELFRRKGHMKILALSLWVLFSAMPAFAHAGGERNGGFGHDRGYGVGHDRDDGNRMHAAPAPLLGFGIPSALAIGGVLLGAKLLRRKR